MKSVNLEPRKSKFFWAYFVFGGLLLTLGVFLLPIWTEFNVFWKGWGEIIINLFVFFLINMYVFGYLLRKLNKEKNKNIIILIVTEMVILLLIAVGCILEMFDTVQIGGPCVILGAAFWLRGAVHILKGYFYRNNKKEQSSFALLLLAIVFVTGGTVLVINPFFEARHLIWVMASTVIAIGCVCVLWGVLSIPHKSDKLVARKSDIFVDMPLEEISQESRGELEEEKKSSKKKSSKAAEKEIPAIEAPISEEQKATEEDEKSEE